MEESDSTLEFVGKPCPFCGHKGIDAYSFDANDGKMYFVAFCASCRAEAPRKEKRSQALKAWNKRSDEE